MMTVSPWRRDWARRVGGIEEGVSVLLNAGGLVLCDSKMVKF